MATLPDLRPSRRHIERAAGGPPAGWERGVGWTPYLPAYFSRHKFQAQAPAATPKAIAATPILMWLSGLNPIHCA
jgi:hypothetical protein